MNDNLDTLSDQELNELFAVEVAEWKPMADIYDSGCYWDGKRTRLLRGSDLHKRRDEMQIESREPFLVDFCADSNAVLPLLERAMTFDVDYMSAEIDDDKDHYRIRVNTYAASAPTFARAAVIALLRWKRVAAVPHK